ncbi:hypothetical protein OG440_31220 [Streptomyces sp. NBC_00637]|uniref:hypothetical protein n=1 Tax=Streptomyces sp. NBC_00637 TaxID=2903667 RepID=UPI003251AA9F
MGDGSHAMEVLMEINALPRVDEHTTVVTAEAGDVWRGLGETLGRSRKLPRAARQGRPADATDGRAPTPGPLAEGSTLRGFQVAEAVAGRELVLVGSHRFSSYALVFHLDEAGPGRTRLCAETRAVFPGRAGGLYRRLVIDSGGHGVVVRGKLGSVRRRAERR